MSKFITSHAKHRLGFLGDFATEYWTEEDWREHREYVAELKASGEYGKEIDVTYHLQYNPLFDDPSPGPAKVSYSYVMIDFSSDNHKIKGL